MTLAELPGAAGKNAKEIVDSIAENINTYVPEVKTAVDNIIAQLDRLAGLSVSVTVNGTYNSTPVVTKPGQVKAYPLAVGMDYVPFDGFLATLHEGESVLTAEENRIWQRFKNGGSGVDYDTMGGVMRDNIKAGGNVYLDGRVVGQVISEEQGRSYRQLQRSGWQG